MPTLNIKVAAAAGSAITGAAVAVDERWVKLDDDLSGSVNIPSGTYWIAWLVSGVSGSKFTVTGWTTDSTKPLFKESRVIAIGNTQHQGYKGFTL